MKYFSGYADHVLAAPARVECPCGKKFFARVIDSKGKRLCRECQLRVGGS